MTIVDEMLPAFTDFAQSVDWAYVLKIALLVGAGVCILGGVLRLICGRNSSLVRSVSACVSLVMIYLAGILLYLLVPQTRGSLATLPFLTVTEEYFYLWDIAGMEAASLYVPLLQLFILAFLVNLLEVLLPSGKNVVTWYGFRLLTVAVSLGLYTAICALVNAFAPQVFGQWAGWILIGIWVFIILIALLKLLLTLILAIVNPVVAALYSFFFSHLVGKQFTKAILTTLLSAGLLALLHHLGFLGFTFDHFSLAAYGPTCVIALLALYLFGKLL